jgi:hypothetical protein
MLWVLEVAFIFCVSGVGFWCEPLRVGFGGIHVCLVGLRILRKWNCEIVVGCPLGWSVARFSAILCFVVSYCWCRYASFSQSCYLFTDSEDLHIRGQDSLRG